MKTSVCVYLILTQNEKVLLSLRQNTGYEDNKWGLIAGHQEEGEPASKALIREAKEEIGIDIDPKDVQVVHVMHRKSNRENIDIFFRCEKWKGEIQNMEPHKCGKVSFFDPNSLPDAMVHYVKEALQLIKAGSIYSEVDFEVLANTTI